MNNRGTFCSAVTSLHTNEVYRQTQHFNVTQQSATCLGSSDTSFSTRFTRV